MAAPFSGEDLFKRSLIGSILGFKIKTPKFHQQQQDQSNVRQHSTTAPHFDFDQPCSSKTVLQLDNERQQNFVPNNYVQNLPSSRHLPRQQQQQPHSHQQERQPQQQDQQQQQFCKQQNLAEHSIQTQFSVESDHKSRNYVSQNVGTVVENVSLSDQLSESLFLASPQALTPTSQFSADAQTVSYHPLVSSPHDIYQEIVHECEPFLGKHQLDQPILTSNSDSLIANASKTGAETEYRAEISNKNPYFLQSRNQAFSQSDERPISAYTHVEPNQKFDENVIQVNEIPYYRHQQQINQSSYCIPNTVGALPPSSLSNASPLRARHPTAPMNTGGYCIGNMEEQNSTSSLDIPIEDPKIIPPPRYGQHLPFPDEQLYYNSHDCNLPQPRSPSFYAADNLQPLNRNEYDYFIQDNFENEESFMKSAAEVLASKILLGVEVAPNSPQEAQAKKDEPKEQRQQKLGSILNGQVSLEELVKMVVAAVKEAGGLADREKQKLVTSPQPQPSIIHSSKRPETTASGETPEEILQRKRQQNNEAAARYRKRQRSARFIAEDEIRVLMRRNAEIKAEIAMVEREIEVLKEQFTIAQPIPRKRGVKPTNEKIEQVDSNDAEIDIDSRVFDSASNKLIIIKRN